MPETDRKVIENIQLTFTCGDCGQKTHVTIGF